MDDKDKNVLAGGAGGATIGGLIAGPPGAVVGGIIGAALGGKETDHHGALRDTAKAIAEEVGDSGRLHADHIKPDGTEDGGTRSVIDDLEHHPDLIYTAAPGSGYAHLIIEVETMDSLQSDRSHVLSQLEDFRVNGYKRVLVVPGGDISDAEAWCDTQRSNGDLDGRLHLVEPERVATLL